MKNALFLVLVALLMFGCGGGGGITTSSNGIPGDGTGGGTGGGGGTPSGPVGFITVSFSKSATPTTLVPVSTGGQTEIENLRSHFRVVIKRVDQVEAIDEEGNSFTYDTEVLRVVADNTVPGELRIAVPAGTNYTVEVLTYDQEGSINYMLEYWKSNYFDLSSGDTVTPTWATSGAVSTYITMTLPDNVTSNFSYTASVTKTVPVRRNYYLTQQESTELWPISGFNPILAVGYGTTEGISRIASNVSFTAPVVSTERNLYLQGQFFIDDSLLSAGERVGANPPTWSNWRINCPDYRYTDNVVSTLLLPGNVLIEF